MTSTTNNGAKIISPTSVDGASQQLERISSVPLLSPQITALNRGLAGNLRAQQLRHLIRQIQRLAGVEPGVAGRGVADVEMVLHDLLLARPAQALGDIVAGQLHV